LPEIDSKLQEYWGENAPVARVISPPQEFVLSANCSNCKTASSKRICPHCHAELPRTIGEYKNFIIAIVGSKNTGKSNFVTVLIETLRREGRQKFGFFITAENEYSLTRYEDEFRKPIYEDSKALDSTASAFTDNRIRRPLLFNLRYDKAARRAPVPNSRMVTLSFFDSAGEDLKSEQVMAAVNRYIFKADCIIVLIDPLQFPQVRKRMGGDIRLPDSDSDGTRLINSIARLIRDGRGLAAGAKVDTPIAVTVSKADILQKMDDVLDPGSPLLWDSNHSGGFDSADFEAVGQDVETLITRLGGQPLLDEIHSSFSNVGFFVVSALGDFPDQDLNIHRLAPRRVIDPFLWLLQRRGLYPKKRS